jgi:hypothetical protein
MVNKIVAVVLYDGIPEPLVFTCKERDATLLFFENPAEGN